MAAGLCTRAERMRATRRQGLEKGLLMSASLEPLVSRSHIDFEWSNIGFYMYARQYRHDQGIPSERYPGDGGVIDLVKR